VATFISPINGFFSRFIKVRFNRWLNRRIPPASQHILSNRNIFIIPTRFGFVYLIFVVLLFLLATNYQNNVIMLLSYLMASIFITTMMHSFFNLSDLTLSAGKKAAGYVKQNISFPIKISSTKTRLSLNFCFDKQQAFHLPKGEKGEQTIYVPCYYKKRGVYYPGRLKISSEYSLGLFKTWTRIDFGNQCTVYPESVPLSNSQSNFTGSSKLNSTLEKCKPGTDDFFELKAHILGDPMSRIAWKQFARGQGRLTKHYHQPQGTTCWLKLIDMPNNGIEKQLQYLCFLVNQCNQAGQVFGLDLSQEKILPSKGDHHFKQCLMALAIYTK
jgi:uncharacterized protein (DUF58 family)